MHESISVCFMPCSVGVATQLLDDADLHVLFLGASYPPAQRPEQAVSVAGDRSAAPRRNVRCERADVAGTVRRRQRELNGEMERRGLSALPVDTRRVEHDGWAEERPADGTRRRDARR